MVVVVLMFVEEDQLSSYHYHLMLEKQVYQPQKHMMEVVCIVRD